MERSTIIISTGCLAFTLCAAVSCTQKEKHGSITNPISYPEMLKVKADLQHSNTIVNGVSHIGYMSGGKNSLWKDEDFSFILT